MNKRIPSVSITQKYEYPIQYAKISSSPALTAMSQTIQAANQNPADTLGYE